MKSSSFYAVLGIGIILIVSIVWWAMTRHHAVPAAVPAAGSSATTTQATSTPPLAGMSIYTNGQYGFSLLYPGSDIATTTFASYYHLPSLWRIEAPLNATGTPIIAIIGYQTTSTDSYPRYFDAEIRIGASNDPKALESCTQVGDGEAPQPSVTINGTVWQVFAFQDVGMMQYADGISYRTIHNDTCFAIEQIETGSSYHDDPPSSKDIPDSVLTQHYNDLAAVIKTFSFAR